MNRICSTVLTVAAAAAVAILPAAAAAAGVHPSTTSKAIVTGSAPQHHAPLGTMKARAATSTSTTSIWLANASNERLVTHGSGNPLTIEGSGYTQFYGEQTSDSGFLKWHVANSTNCLTYQSSTSFVVSSGCNPGDDNQEWTQSANGAGCLWRSKGISFASMETHGDVSGDRVIEAANQNGDYIRWGCIGT